MIKNQYERYSGESYIAYQFASRKDWPGIRFRTVERGFAFRHQGSPTPEIHLLLSGVAFSFATSSSGKESGTGLYLPSSLIGEDFTSKDNTAIDSAKALSEAQIATIHRSKIADLLSHRLAVDELSKAVGNDFYNFRRLMIVRNQETSLESLGQLIYLLTNSGTDRSVRISQDEMAVILNSQRSRVSENLRELKAIGHITRPKGASRNPLEMTKIGRDCYSVEIAD